MACIVHGLALLVDVDVRESFHIEHDGRQVQELKLLGNHIVRFAGASMVGKLFTTEAHYGGRKKFRAHHQVLRLVVRDFGFC